MQGKRPEKRFQGNKEIFYKKAKQWYSVRGKIAAEGFERLKFKQTKAFIEIRHGEGTIKVPWIIGKKVSFVFREKNSPNRIIIVSKSIERNTERPEEIKLKIEAHYGIASSGILMPKKLAEASATYVPKHKAVFTSNFMWFGSDRRNELLELTPSWLEGKGFGLFLDSLRQIELSKLGAKKWFTAILHYKESRSFAELRGFRKITEDEAKFVKENFANIWSLKEIKRCFFVKEIVPVSKHIRKK